MSEQILPPSTGSSLLRLDLTRQRYDEERQRRLRSEGVTQYIQPLGRFARLDKDPWVTSDRAQAPFIGEIDVLVIGGGFTGLSVAARLVQAGFANIRIVEAGSDFGGTWYWNQYPGAQCDTESYIYLPLLEETGYIPTEKYVKGPEILGHARRIAKQFELYDHALLQTRVSDMHWSDADSSWRILTDMGDRITARFVVKTNGTLDRPKLPGIPGIESFNGHIFHTSRWDYSYTGGHQAGELSSLADKRVAVVGTGATGIQVVPVVARYAKHLYVVQRTPSTVAPRENRPTDDDFEISRTPGWQRQRRQNFVALTSGVPQDRDLVADGWTQAVRKLGNMFATSDTTDISPEAVADRLEIADLRHMDEIRDHISKVVRDPATAEALKPWYRYFCKRPCFSDTYLETFNRSNVTLLDTAGQGPNSIGENAIRVKGADYEVDCIIFATGFEVGTDPIKRAGYEVYGREGMTLSQAWANSMVSLHGCMTHGFPNLFQAGLGQNGVSYVFTYSGDNQATHIVEILKSARDAEANYVEPTVDAQASWGKIISTNSGGAITFQESCTPGLYNNEGSKSDRRSIVEEAYGGGPIEFYDLIERWRENGMKGLTIK